MPINNNFVKFILIICLFILNISGCSNKNEQHIQSIKKNNVTQKSLYTPEEKQCLSKLNANELLELMDLFLIKDKGNFKKKNPNINVCKEYFKHKESTSPIKKEALPLMHFARGINQKTIKLPNNDVLIIGGNKTDIITVELFDNKEKLFHIITNNLNQYLNKDISTLKEPFCINNKYIYYQGAIYDIKKKQFIKSKNELRNKLDAFDQQISSKEWQHKTHLKFYKLFDDGKVLFESNCDNYNGCKGLKLIDPIDGITYKEGNFKNKKDNFEVVFLNDETVLIIGGYGYHIDGSLLRFNYIEAYNPKNGNISLLGKLDSDFNFDPSFYYPGDLNTNKDVYKSLIIKNDLLIPSYNWNKSFLYKYNIESKQIINKYKSHFYTLVQGETFQYPKYSLQHVIYPLGINKLLYVPEIKNTLIGCNQRCNSCLLDLSKDKECIILDYSELLYPFQVLTPLNNGEILATGGIKCSINKPDVPFSKEAYLIKDKIKE